MTCLEPLQRWRVGFRGAGRPTSRSELAAARLVDGEVVGLEADLTFDACAPIWDLGALHSLGETHYEQHGRLSGTVTVAGTIYRVDAAAYRDHSTGKRDMAGLGGHVWAHATFPSGRAFTALQVFDPDGRLVLNDGALVTDGVLAPAAPESAPGLDDASGSRVGGPIVIPGQAPISVDVLHGVTFTLGRPNDFFFGYDPELGGPVLSDCPARYTWDGEVATGWLERSRSSVRRPAVRG